MAGDKSGPNLIESNKTFSTSSSIFFCWMRSGYYMNVVMNVDFFRMSKVMWSQISVGGDAT